MVVAFPEPVFPNGIAVEAEGSVVWDDSHTGHVRRHRPDCRIEDLGRMPGDSPISSMDAAPVKTASCYKPWAQGMTGEAMAAAMKSIAAEAK